MEKSLSENPAPIPKQSDTNLKVVEQVDFQLKKKRIMANSPMNKNMMFRGTAMNNYSRMSSLNNSQADILMGTAPNSRNTSNHNTFRALKGKTADGTQRTDF